jgi:hypothetical protein
MRRRERSHLDGIGVGRGNAKADVEPTRDPDGQTASSPR